MSATIHPTAGGLPRHAIHVVHHAGACGEHVPSPHPACQKWAYPYNAAERVCVTRTSIGNVRVVLYRCHGCNATWQGSETAA